MIEFLGQDRLAAEFIGGKLGLVFWPYYEVLGILSSAGPQGERELRGGIVFTGRNGANVDATIYAPGQLTRALGIAVGELVFVKWKYERITARCRRANVVTRSTLARLGWTFEGTQRRYWGSTKADDAMVYGFLATDWLNGGFHGRAYASRSGYDSRSTGAIKQRNGDNAVRAWRN